MSPVTSTMTDVDFFRPWDGATISTTVTDGDWSDVENLRHQGYIVTRTVIIR